MEYTMRRAPTTAVTFGALGLLLALISSPSTAQAACAPVPDSLVGWWKLDGNANDQTGNHPGTVVAAGGTYTAGEVGQGFHPAPGSLVVVPDQAQLNAVDFTIDAWVKLDVIPSVNAGIFWKGSSSGANVTSPFGLGIFGSVSNPSVAGRLYLTTGNGASGQLLNSSAAIPTGSFVHVAATADGATLKLYVNGVLAGSLAQTVSPGPSAFSLQIGGIAGLSTNGVPGTIDEAELHRKAAAAAAIKAIFDAGSQGKCDATTSVHSPTWGRLKTIYR
jgi:hypothetical protein